jgi:hypothetical protein
MRRLNRLLTFKSKSSVSVTSTDGTLTVPIVNNVKFQHLPVVIGFYVPVE